jgi:hypothetical protein
MKSRDFPSTIMELLMGIDEVRANFLGYSEKRLRLQLLLGELEGVRSLAGSMIALNSKSADGSFNIATFDSAIIDSVMMDTYPITANSPRLIAMLRNLRLEMGVANNKMRMLLSVVSLPMSNTHELVQQHNAFMAGRATSIIAACDEAMRELKVILGE